MKEDYEEEEKGFPDEQDPIADELIRALQEIYEPAEHAGTEVELKSTTELLEEMAAIADVPKWQITSGMITAGFKTTYNDAGFFWMLKRK